MDDLATGVHAGWQEAKKETLASIVSRLEAAVDAAKAIESCGAYARGRLDAFTWVLNDVRRMR